MSARDFEAIAGVLASARRRIAGLPGDEYRATVRLHREVAEDLARVCAGVNPRFDRARFMVAAGAWHPFERTVAEAVRDTLDSDRSVTA